MDGSTPTFLVPRPTLLDVVQWMVRFAHKGKSDLRVRKLVEQLCAGLEPFDYASEAYAIYAWVHQNVRYMKDIHDVEFLKEPGVLLDTLSGDCDDISTLIAAMLMASGNQAVFSVVAFDGEKAPSHVFCNLVTKRGLIALDPVANISTSEMLRRITWRADVVV
jgi:transglutaminase-like putative cysteine protease